LITRWVCRLIVPVRSNDLAGTQTGLTHRNKGYLPHKTKTDYSTGYNGGEALYNAGSARGVGKIAPIEE
jgi:hypothetical protein